MSRGAVISPKLGTGALNQVGSRARQSWRKAWSRGHSAQSRSGSTPVGDTVRPRAGSVVELVVIIVVAAADPLRRGAALQELRGVARLARLPGLARRPLGGVAADRGLQLDDVEEDIGLAAQLIGNHRRLCRDGGHHR